MNISSNNNKRSPLQIFMRNKVAANLLMGLMIISGIVALLRINVQFLPTFEIGVISVRINWPGAVAEDIEKSLVNPIEKELNSIENLKRISSVARQSFASLTLEFHQNTDMSRALDKVREGVGRIKNFPPESEKPIIAQVEPYELIAKLLIYGTNNLDELREIAHQFKKELSQRGIGKINIVGLPQKEIIISFKPKTLTKYKLSLNKAAELIRRNSQDIPAGKIAEGQLGQSLRILQKKRSIKDFKQLDFITDKDGERIKLGEVATIHYQTDDEEVKVFYKNKPAVMLKLMRETDDNALKAANVIHKWLSEKEPELGNSLHLKLYEEKWILIKQRIDTLVNNGFTGLVLIIVILFIFLERKVANWVVVGIPTALLSAIFVLFLTGGSINMVSLFAFILMLGIIVDDNIVIGEEGLSNLHNGMPISQAMIVSSKKMLPAIFSSSLTTIAAFFPLLFIGGPIGKVLFDIPLVVICVIISSLIECFIILPGHLYHSYKKSSKEDSSFRKKIDNSFESFTINIYQPLLKLCIKHKATVLTATLALMLISISLIVSHHIKFNFFPTPDAKQILAQVRFIPGCPESNRIEYFKSLETAANQTALSLEKKYQTKKLIRVGLSIINKTNINVYAANTGKQFGTYYIELIGSEERTFTNNEFIKEWQKLIKPSPFVESISVMSPRGGPPGRDIEISIRGNNIINIKKAALDLQQALQATPGVFAIEDNLPFSQEQIVYQLNQQGYAIGLTHSDLGHQLRSAFWGEIVQTDYTPDEEISIKTVLADVDKNKYLTLYNLPIITPSKKVARLEDIVDVNYKQSPEIIIHDDTQLSAKVTAEVDPKINNADEILDEYANTIFKDLKSKYNIKLKLKGKSETQSDTLNDMKLGLILALFLIYVILSWVFGSYRLPWLVMIAIPLGLIGAILGHYFMGLDLTMLSLFGFFGLSGIVINDSIILVREYQLQKKHLPNKYQALIIACSKRLRAIILTSITTVTGLLPLLFEKSRQAHFLIPMASSICFGLIFATFLLLLVIPIFIAIIEGCIQD